MDTTSGKGCEPSPKYPVLWEAGFEGGKFCNPTRLVEVDRPIQPY